MVTDATPPADTFQVTAGRKVSLPTSLLEAAGLAAGDTLEVRTEGPGRLVLERRPNPIDEHAGSLTGVWPAGELDRLRDEWDRTDPADA